MARIRLLHWNAAEAGKYLSSLAVGGHTVEYDERFEPRLLRQWRAQPPDVFVIDLSRSPALGREIAIGLRQWPATRRVPVVFCDGAPEKVEKTRALLSDALYCEFSKLRSSIRKALTSPCEEVIVPTPMMKRYTAHTTAQKLGIAAGGTVAVIDPPRDYLAVLGDLPSGVQFTEDPAASVTLCFVHDVPSLQSRMSELRRLARTSKLWFCWRKGATATSGLSGQSIRATAIALGLIDYKVCSLNTVWTGMLFAVKR